MIVRARMQAALLRIAVTAMLLVGICDAILSQSLCSQGRCTCESFKIVCSCIGSTTQQNIVMTYLKYDTISNITIHNCESVTIKVDAIKDLRNLRHLQLSNIGSLQLEEHSLNWTYFPEYGQLEYPKVDIFITNSTINDVPRYAIKGTIGELRLDNVRINSMQPYALSSIISAIKIEIKSCTISGVHDQAFKKFKTENLIISDTKMGTLPSRAFSDVEVTDTFKIDKSNFETVKSSAFIILHPKKVEILNSYFNVLEGDGFKIRTKGRVTIKNNYFKKLNTGAFKGISLISDYYTVRQELVFDNNSVYNLQKGSLYFNETSYIIKLGRIILNETCDCAGINSWAVENEWNEQIHCITDSGETMKISSLSDKCDSSSNNLIIVVSTISAVLLVLILGVTMFFLYKRYKETNRKEYINRGKPGSKTLGLIVPDGRTYKETELHVIIEKAELLTTEL